MGKTFDALKKAEQEQELKFLHPVPQVQKSVELYSPLKRIADSAPPWCQELWLKLKQRSQQEETKTIVFTGLSHGSGCTSSAAIFSVYLAVRIQKKVLTLDLNTGSPGLKRFFSADDHTLFAEVLDPSSLGKADSFSSLKQNLAVVINDSDLAPNGSTWLESDILEQFIAKARNGFDFVIFDAGHVTQSIETRLLCSKADAVIIVISAGESRKSVALRVKDELEQSGAKIAGVILNKRKYYIPKWLYSRL
jgi:Mrp family chromosome partitioning ATPase